MGTVRAYEQRVYLNFDQSIGPCPLLELKMNNKKRIVVISIIAVLALLSGNASAHGFTLEEHITVLIIIAGLFVAFCLFIFIIIQIVKKHRDTERQKKPMG